MTDMLWQVSDITNAVGAPIPKTEAAVLGISIDTRTLEKGDLFIALQGDVSDGHAYLNAAFEAGATAAIVKTGTTCTHENALLIEVEDTLRAMQALGAASRDRSKALRIAVTGSAGKTGTKEMLGTVFSNFGKTHTSVKSYNNHWGVPLTLSRMPAQTDYGVFEVGMNHAGEISNLTQQIKPDIAIITTILPAHIEFFESETDIARAKMEIIDGLDLEAGHLILNGDTPYFDIMKKIAVDAGIKNIHSFGEDDENDTHIISLKLAAHGSKVKANILGTPVKFSLSIPGKHIALNALSVLTAAKLAGCDLEKTADLISTAEPIEGRGAQKQITIQVGAPPITLIDESYNANPAAMQAAFKVLELTEPKESGRRIAILGDMLELGSQGPEFHANLANPLLKSKTDLVFCCGPLMGALFDTLPPPWQGAHEKDSFALCPFVKDAVQPGDVILIKGSLGSKMAYVVEALQSLSTKENAKDSNTTQEVA